jgi:DNA-binding XRE family transcriptional regulator
MNEPNAEPKKERNRDTKKRTFINVMSDDYSTYDSLTVNQFKRLSPIEQKRTLVELQRLTMMEKVDESSLNLKVGDWMKIHRKELELTQEAMAEQCELSRTYYSDLERGVKTPSLAILKKIAIGFGVPLYQICKDKDI